MATGGSALLVLIGGGTAGIAAATAEEPRIVTTTGQDAPAAAGPVPAPGVPVPQAPAADSGLGTQIDTMQAERRTSDAADRTATRAPRTASTQAAPPHGVAAGLPAGPPAAAPPVITTRTVTQVRAIPFRTRLVRDPELSRGSKRVQTPGVPGEETLRYLVTFSDGRETGRRLVDTTVTREPQHRVVAFGTRRGDGDGSGDCGPGGCLPAGRGAVCPDDVDAAVTEGTTPLGGSLTLPDEDLRLLDPDDLDGLELDTTLLC